jgi:chromate transporter
MSQSGSAGLRPRGSAIEVFRAFLLLGVSAFGGPIAHLGYFRDAFVHRRRWLDEDHYAELVALCQFLPGPTSSQVGFAIGLDRAGPLGGLAAWCGFTLPSAALMTVLGLETAALSAPWAAGALAGLRLVALAVVAQALFGMARSLTPDPRRAAIAVICALVASFAPHPWSQVAALVVGGALGLIPHGGAPVRPAPARVSGAPMPALIAGGAFFALLFAALWAGGVSHLPALDRFNAFFRSGALVFGGGHVVLPLLDSAVVARGWVPSATFLAGYGAAQALPGPLFAFAAFLGAAMKGPPSGLPGAVLALVAIFLPGLLSLLACRPLWGAIRSSPVAGRALEGVNAAVVGLLASAFVHPLWTEAITGPADIVAAGVGFGLLVLARLPPLAIVTLGLVFGLARWALAAGG